MEFSKRLNKIFIVLLTIIISVGIFLTCFGAVYSNHSADAILASNIASQTTNLPELLLEDYETTGGKQVFDLDIFNKLLEQISGIPKANISSISGLGEKTSADFRTNNGKDIVVTIGGKQWTATYLSQNNKGEPILTFLLADGANDVRFNSTSTNSDGNYPSNMYGTSAIRAVTLNNGGGYAETYNATSLTPTSKDLSSEWAIYTMDISEGCAGSISKFIEVPDNMSWQHNQSALTSAPEQRFKYNHNNDALDIGGTGTTSYLNKTGYKNWANDKLWLPSVAETGQNGESGIWKMSNAQRAITRNNTYNYFWLRTAMDVDECYRAVQMIDSGGSSLSYSAASNIAYYRVRPAFHLNLKLAEESTASVLSAPSDTFMEYTSERIGVHSLPTLPSWYVSSAYDSSALITTLYKNKNTGIAISGGLPRDEGEYTVEFTLTADGAKKLKWEDSATNTSPTRSITFRITPKPIKYTLSGGGSTLPKVEHDVSDLGTNDTKLAQGTVLGFRYTGLYGSSYNDTKLPTVNGTYRATVIALNHNYTPDSNITPNYKDFSVEGARANVPTFNDTTQGYDGGNAVNFVLSGFDSDQMEIVTPLPSGVSYDGVEIISATKA
ncbi:MAG: hypothetical protein K2H24_02435, partial [Clostridia bacterium]|nr:hypothetical protein [Clostridia bacterium]